MRYSPTYGYETYGQYRWKKRRRPEAFEMWVYRRMVKISKIDRINNEEVVERMSE